MSKQTGRETNLRQERFLKQEVRRGIVKDAFSKLRHSFLDEDDFEELEAWFSRAKSSSVHTISEFFHETSLPRISRMQRTSLATVGDFVSTSPNAQIPSTSFLEIRSNLILLNEREWPVTFITDHIEKRFERRSNDNDDELKPLDYASLDLRFSLYVATAMTRVISETEASRFDEDNRIPVAIPHNDGLFVGFAEQCDETGFHGSTSVLERDILGNITADTLGKFQCITPDWSPDTEITITSFIGKKNFHDDQKRLHALFMKRLSPSGMQLALDFFGASYGTGQIEREMGPTSKESKQAQLAVKRLDTNLKKILRSKDWDEYSQHSKESLKKTGAKHSYPRRLPEDLIENAPDHIRKSMS